MNKNTYIVHGMNAESINLEAFSLQCPRSDISHNYDKLIKG